MQMSGGHLLAAGLDGGNTIIFFSIGEENANRVLLPAFCKAENASRVLLPAFCKAENTVANSQ